MPPETDVIDFAAIIDAERERQGIAKAELARRVGLTQQRYGDIVAGRRGLSIDTLSRLMLELGLTIKPTSRR